MRVTAAAPPLPGSGPVGEKRVAWVNVVAIDLAKLQRKDQGFIYCLWVGFPTSYHQEAQRKGERTPRHNCPYFMQLASDACINSHPGVLRGGARGGCSLAFPSDMPTVEMEETDPVVPVTRDGGRVRMAASTPVVSPELGGPLFEDTLPENAPDDKCSLLTLGS